MDKIIGIDLAKQYFQVHAADHRGEVIERRKLTRDKVRTYMSAQQPAIVVMEACGSAHYWSREFAAMGHSVKLIAPQYVKAFVKRQKNDAADAEAIVIASLSPGMRFVTPKGADQQAKAVLFRARERLVHHRTELTNALRAVLYEYGYIIPQGLRNVARIQEIVDAPNSDLPTMVREECCDMLDLISRTTEGINKKAEKIREQSKTTDLARRLQTMPGVGPVLAMAIEAFAPPMEFFDSGRNFAAWLGLVPRQFSSGGKERLGKVSKAGQGDIRRLLIIGAMSRLNWLGKRSIVEGSWLSRLVEKGKPKMLVAIALANKMARQVWAMLTKQEDYRNPTPVLSA